MVALPAMVALAGEPEADETTESSDGPVPITAGTVACLINGGWLMLRLGSGGGGISSVVENGCFVLGHRARSRWRFVRLVMEFGGNE